MIVLQIQKLANSFYALAQGIDLDDSLEYDDGPDDEEQRVSALMQDLPEELDRFHQKLLEFSPEYQREQKIKRDLEKQKDLTDWLDFEYIPEGIEKNRKMWKDLEKYLPKKEESSHIPLEDFEF